MGSINKSHIEENGGVLLFNGELVLLYCDSVSCEIGGKESFKGRVYLTTHRLVVVISPFRQNAPVKSFCAPFCAIVKCGVEQPIFGANYIEATVRDEADPSKSFSFKLKFNKGGAIELAMAMNRAVQLVGRNYNASVPPPPAYTPSPSAQYYQAPPTVYAPGYNSGIPMPTQQFPDQPPIGFIYASDAPPPYPGLGGQGGAQGHQGQQQSGGGYPGQQQQPSGGYPGQQPQQFSGYSGQQPTQQSGGYPGQQQPGAYPGQQQPGAYPGQQQPATGYPGQQPSAAQHQAWAGNNNPGYPVQQGGYPNQYPAVPQQQQWAATGQPGSAPPPSAGAYPDLSTAGNPAPSGPQPTASQHQGGQAWPSAPSFNPNWQDDKKNA